MTEQKTPEQRTGRPYQLLTWTLYRHDQPVLDNEGKPVRSMENMRKIQEHNQWHAEQNDGLVWRLDTERP